MPAKPVKLAAGHRSSLRRASYNYGMPSELFVEMKQYLGFGEDDAQILASLYAPLRSSFPEIVDRFYMVLHQHPGARAVLAAKPGRMERLRQSLEQWLAEFFSGVYDDAYYVKRCNIGRVHVLVELPQHYMFTAMNVIRLALTEKILALNLLQGLQALRALHKLLDLELAIMNQTYREDLISRMKEIEQAQFEQRLGESQHLATIGQLAASSAHEIKNPLAGISGAIQVLGADLLPGHPRKEIIDEALRQIDRLDSAVRDLLVYARPKPPERSRVDLTEIVMRTLMLLREEPAFRNIPVHSEGFEVKRDVLADEPQIQQVLTNIMLNAAHACENGGAIHLQIESFDSKVRLLILDEGVGMTPEVLSRAFEPFFTTKARGTGLGLSICKRIMEAHRGTLEIQSSDRRGTTVAIELPKAP